MKLILQKLSLLSLLAILSNSLFAQTITVSAKLGGLTYPISNGSTVDATAFGSLTTYLPLTMVIGNTSTTTALTLIPNSASTFVALSGSGASDFVVNESGLTASIAAGSSKNFVVDRSANITNGTKTVTFTIKSSDQTIPIYTGTINYTISGVTTSIVKASEIGLSLYPNPSNDGHFSVKADNIDVSRIVVSNVSGVTEEYTSKEFKTNLKGLLLLQVYTSKGLVSEKVLVQ